MGVESLLPGLYKPSGSRNAPGTGSCSLWEISALQKSPPGGKAEPHSPVKPEMCSEESHSEGQSRSCWAGCPAGAPFLVPCPSWGSLCVEELN